MTEHRARTGGRAPDPRQVDSPSEFVAQLRLLKVWAGSPSFQRLARLSGVPRSTLADALSKHRDVLPRLDVVRRFVLACGMVGGDAAAWEERWRELQATVLSTDAEQPHRDRRPPHREGRPVPRQLPADISGFVGRGEAMSALDGMLERRGRAGPVVIPAVSGTAGVGKTALAVHWAHRVADRFPDGQLYVDLRGFDADGRMMAPAEAVRGFLDALGVPPERVPVELDAQAGLYRSLLAGRRMLVVLDNARDAEQVRPLLPGTPGCLVLVTSRNQLTPLVAVDGARTVVLDILSTEEAWELLADRLGADRVSAEPDAVGQIVTACARLPLALVIAGARAHETHYSLAALAAELNEAGRRLEALDAGDSTSQVRAVFSWSHTAISLPAARLFRLLGLHPGPDISVAAAASLAGQPDARRLLTELAHANVIVEHVRGRYTFHDLLRAYAGELARDDLAANQRRAAVARMLDHYVHTSHAADRLLLRHRNTIRLPLGPPSSGSHPEHLCDQRQAMVWLTAERRVLLAALRLAAGTGFDTHAWQLAWALDTFLDRRGHWHDKIAIWQAALDPARRLDDPAVLADSYRLLGSAGTRLGHHADAGSHLRHALDLYTKAGDPVGQASTQHSLAHLAQRQGNPERALDHAQRALTLYQVAGHRRGQANALNAVGWGHALLGDHCQALAHCERALPLFQQLSDRDGEALTWDSLGYANHHLGNLSRAVDCYQHALGLFRDLGERYNEAESLTHVGDTHHAAGDPDTARTAWQQALEILTDLEHPDTQAVRAKLHDLVGAV